LSVWGPRFELGPPENEARQLVNHLTATFDSEMLSEVKSVLLLEPEKPLRCLPPHWYVSENLRTVEGLSSVQRIVILADIWRKVRGGHAALPIIQLALRNLLWPDFVTTTLQ
jgi:hypothetical protein